MKVLLDRHEEVTTNRYFVNIEDIIKKYLKEDVEIGIINAHNRIIGIDEVKSIINTKNLNTANLFTIINWSMIKDNDSNDRTSKYLKKRRVCDDNPYNISTETEGIKVEFDFGQFALFIPEFNILYLTYDAIHGQTSQELELIDFILHNLTQQLDSSNIFKSELLKFQEVIPEKIEVITDNDKVIPNIIESNKIEEIINKMISMVDIERFKKLLAIAGSSDGKKNMPSKEVTQDYLRRWALSKYEYFLLFDNELSIEKEIQFEIDNIEMKSSIENLCYTFPKYAPVLSRINSNEFIENSIDGDEIFEKYADKKFKKGMKVSKFLSTYLEDNIFDIELSKVLQNRLIKGKVVISIDPYDYLTMSINSHQWRSCHRITDGEYATGGFSYMCDDSTLIAYRENGTEYKYNLYGFKFEGNSKSWRQCVYFDKSTCSIIFGRQYPNDIKEVSTEVRNILEEKVSTYTNNINLWSVTRNEHKGTYEKISNLNYHDVDSGFDYKFARFKNLYSTDDIIFKIGSEVKCVYCGKLLSENDSKVSCGCK